MIFMPVIASAASGKSAEDLILYPKANSIVRGSRPMIGADFKGLVSTGDAITPIVSLDGIDITPQCDIQLEYVLCMRSEDVSPGEHEAALKLLKDGKELLATSWKFTIGWKPSERFMYPNPGKAVENEQPVIGLNYSEFPMAINPESVQLMIDGVDMTHKAQVTEDAVFFQPEDPMGKGAHKIVIKARTSSGSRIEPIAWNLVIGEEADLDTRVAQTIPRNSYSKMIAYTGNRLDPIAGASRRMDDLFPKPVMEERVVREEAYASGKISEEEERLAQKKRNEELYLAKQSYIEETGIILGNSYALEFMAGYENLDIGGDFTRSSQLERSAFIHTIGLRTQTNLLDNSLHPQAFNIDFKMTGTSDGDVTESMWDMKSLTARYAVSNISMAAYDIRPKYTTYSLSGKPLLGFQADVETGENQNLNFIAGKFKTNTAGKHVELRGTRYSKESSDGKTSFGIHYLNASIKQLRGGAVASNSLVGVNFLKRYNSGDMNIEWAKSSYSGLGSDTAYKVSRNYRKGKANINVGYESVGNDFRTELGFASKGLSEFSSTVQYQVSNRLTTVIGLKNRNYKDGGSRSRTIPFIAKAQLLKNRPSFKFDFKHQTVNYEKGASTKDTFTDTFSFSDSIGNSMWAFSLKKERKVRSDRITENEQTGNFKLTRPLSDKMKLVLGHVKLKNNIYGAETTNTYALAYDLSDWSDLNYSYKTINKYNPYQDRRTMKFRYGKVNPDSNSEMSFEFSKNMYIDYDETFSAFKYSIFY